MTMTDHRLVNCQRLSLAVACGLVSRVVGEEQPEERQRRVEQYDQLHVGE